MKKKLLIIGASGHGKVVADIAIKMDRWQSIAFLDDDDSVETCMGFEVVGTSADAYVYKHEADFFIAIGRNDTRKKIQEKLEKLGVSIPTLIHPNAVIGNDVNVGTGTVVMAGVVINSSSILGKGCIINTKTSIDHDNVIDDFVHISPGATLAGTVKVGKNSWVGAGSIISNNINICSDCILGAASLTIQDITEPGTYIGVPVRRL